MPIPDIVILCAITFAFIMFGAVLAWGDRQTREIARASRERALTGAHAASLKHSAQAESVQLKSSRERLDHAAAK